MRGHANLPNNNQQEPPYLLTLSPPGGWEGWEPTATETIEFTAVTDISHPGEASITFHLSDVTSYKGRYMNDALWNLPQNTGADIYFAPADEQQTKYGDKVAWSGGGKNSTTVKALWTARPDRPITIPVKIVCNDYAAYGKIHAVLQVPNHDPKSTEPQTIPKDDGIGSSNSNGDFLPAVAGNKLADAWDQSYYNWAMNDASKTLELVTSFTEDQTKLDRDEALIHTGQNSGDGLTVFEEYRGFKLGGSHMRLNPEKKDVFVFSDLGSRSIGYANGLALYVHPIYEDECIPNAGYDPDPPLLNFCSVPGGKNHTAVWVVPLRYGADRAIHRSSKSIAFTPDGRKRCVILEDELLKISARERAVAIGHEVGHAIELKHHSPRVRLAGIDAHGNRLATILFPTKPMDACVMHTSEHTNIQGLKYTPYQKKQLTGSGWASWHNKPTVATVPDNNWDHHWFQHRLHGRHEGHLTYGQP